MRQRLLIAAAGLIACSEDELAGWVERPCIEGRAGDADDDGIPDGADELPHDRILLEQRIGFDRDPGGILLDHGDVVAGQWLGIGVRFRSGYRAARRATTFPCYTNVHENLLCTPTGASGADCPPPAERVLALETANTFDYASLELRTRCDSADGDHALLTAYDASGAVLAATTVTAANGGGGEGVALAVVRVAGIRALTLDPTEFDAIDNLRLLQLQSACGR